MTILLEKLLKEQGVGTQNNPTNGKPELVGERTAAIALIETAQKLDPLVTQTLALTENGQRAFMVSARSISDCAST